MKSKSKISPMVQLSKSMSYLLRHGAEKERVPIRPDGFVKVDDLLNWKDIMRLKATLQSIKNVVQNNDKKRFELQEIEGELYIRCVQGHTIEIDEEQLLEKIIDPNQYPFIIHGTYFQAWELIKNTGLNKMARQHIHFAIGMPGDNQVISGMRQNCEVIIQVDMAKAMESGIEFFISKNNVVLSSGIDGVIGCEFFKSVQDKYGHDLLQNYQQKEQVVQQFQ